MSSEEDYITPCVISNGLDVEMNMLVLDAKGIYKILKDRFEGGTQDEF